MTEAAFLFGELAVSGPENGNATSDMLDNPGAQSLGVTAQQVRPKVCAPTACNKLVASVFKNSAF